MDENTDNKPTEEATDNGQVIDVQVTPPPTETLEVSIEEDGSIIPKVEAAGDPSIEHPPTESQPPETAAPESNTSAPSENTDAAKPDNMAPAPPAAHKSGGPVMAIVAAVLVAVGLAAVTVYAYVKYQDSDKSSKTNQTANETAQDSTAEQIDQVTSEVDGALNSSDDADFSESELTDQNLDL